MANETVSMSIYGQSYTLQANGNAEEIREVAAIVDQKMAELSKQQTLASPLKIAILAALNFAYESKNKATETNENDHSTQKLIALSRYLDDVLN